MEQRLRPSRSWPSARLVPTCIRHLDQEACPHDEYGLETALRVEHSGRSTDRAAANTRTKVSGVMSASRRFRRRVAALSAVQQLRQLDKMWRRSSGALCQSDLQPFADFTADGAGMDGVDLNATSIVVGHDKSVWCSSTYGKAIPGNGIGSFSMAGEPVMKSSTR